MAKAELTKEQKLDLITDLTERAFHGSESFQSLGCGLAYLVMAIANGHDYEILDAADEREAEFIDFMREIYPETDHVIWQFFKFPVTE